MVSIPEIVKKELRIGNIREANRIQGFPYSLQGIVIKGNKLGRTLGFPTANIEPSRNTPLYLVNGVYAVYAKLNGRCYKGVTNIGTRPTLNINQLSIEVNLIDFDEDIYGKTITLFFIERIRDEIKFPGFDALKEQIRIDKDTAERLLRTVYNPDTCP